MTPKQRRKVMELLADLVVGYEVLPAPASDMSVTVFD